MASNGDCTASKAAPAMTHIGTRSKKSPRLTTTGFLRANCSTTLAVKSWGKNHAPWAMTAIKPIGSGSDVSLLTNRGMMVLAEIKLEPNQKVVTSSVLTVKFHG